MRAKDTGGIALRSPRPAFKRSARPRNGGYNLYSVSSISVLLLSLHRQFNSKPNKHLPSTTLPRDPPLQPPREWMAASSGPALGFLRRRRHHRLLPRAAGGGGEEPLHRGQADGPGRDAADATARPSLRDKPAYLRPENDAFLLLSFSPEERGTSRESADDGVAAERRRRLRFGGGVVFAVVGLGPPRVQRAAELQPGVGAGRARRVVHHHVVFRGALLRDLRFVTPPSSSCADCSAAPLPAPMLIATA
jgi:hypothetical protein